MMIDPKEVRLGVGANLRKALFVTRRLALHGSTPHAVRKLAREGVRPC